ncbi:uncharacterized protein LOC110664278 [Hevea brasiliensis]|uniref:uncharacterized protein LOC110664278 n=1 Tax=Hevea brasiliensis TaxID=3981 RepID=UPI0025EC17F1|nr:uncharacterized protein LOC110664278 [Hevea brasiliensis]
MHKIKRCRRWPCYCAFEFQALIASDSRPDTCQEVKAQEYVLIVYLLCYSDINKHLPGPHFDPPSKDQVRVLIQECDLNLDGEIDYDEFVTFIRRLTTDTFAVVSQGLILTLVVAPTVAMATKKATEGVPGVGKVVQKLPNSIYASLVTLAIVWFQNSRQDLD